MKVLGTSNHRTYICEVSHTELEKSQNRYYVQNKLPPLKAGSEMDLGRGYDFHSKIQQAIADGMSNICLGVSIEDQATADERIRLLLETPAAVRWISAC